MFDGFSHGKDNQARKRFAASTGASVVVVAAIVATLTAMASHREPKQEKAPARVVFHRPPPPPPKPLPKPAAPEKKKKKKKKEKHPAARSEAKVNVDVSTPNAIPDRPLAEGDESDFEAAGSVLDISNTAVGVSLGGGAAETAAPPPAPPVRPTILPDGAQPAEPKSSNAPPLYPEEARVAGVEAIVVLQVVITRDGRVTNIRVVKGREPFVSAALAAVKRWRYSPAELDGRPISVSRMIRIPFRLRQ